MKIIGLGIYSMNSKNSYSNLLKYFAYLQFWYQIQDPASKEWSAPAKAAWTTAKSLHWHLALVRKDEGLIVGRRVTGSSPDTEAAGLRKIERPNGLFAA